MTSVKQSNKASQRNKKARRGPADRFADQTLRWQRGLVAATLIGVTLAMQPHALESFAVVKVAVLFVGVAALIAVAVMRVVVTGRAALAGSVAVWATTGLLALTLVVATVTSAAPRVSLLGQHGRGSGLLLYGLALVLFFVILRVYDQANAAQLAIAALGAGTLVTGYAFLQWAGADPVDWDHMFNPVIAFLGNPNFSSAFMGVTVPLAAWVGLDPDRVPALRVAGAGLACLAVALTVATGSIQGTIAGVAGLAVVVLARMLDTQGSVRRVGLPAFAVGAVAGVVMFLAGFAGVGPLQTLQAKETLEIRTWYWNAAAGMVADHPVTGVGIDMYASYYREYRPEETRRWSFGTATDTPHNVPLGMFASGGLPLGLAYLAFIALAGVALLRGLYRQRGAKRLLVGALGGAWLAYQTQAVVSIDMPPLALVHFVLAGGVVVLGLELRQRSVELPWADQALGREAFRQRRSLASGLAVALVVVAVVLAAIPVTANAIAGQSKGPNREQNFDVAAAHLERATARAPWYPEFWSERGKALAAGQRLEEAADALDRALALNPLSFADMMNRVRLAVALRDVAGARARYEELLDRDELAIELRAEFGVFLLSQGELDEGIELLEAALELEPETGSWWKELGRAYLLQDRYDEAERALAEAAVLMPDDAEAFELWELARERIAE